MPTRTFAASWQLVCLIDLDGAAQCYFGAGKGPIKPAVSVPAWDGAVELSLSRRGEHGCARFGDGRVRCAIEPYCAFLGSIPDHIDPVPGLTHATHIAVDRWHACAVDNGCVRCWGYNGEGQLGDGTYRDSDVPTFVRWE